MKKWHEMRGYVELSKDEMEAMELMYSITKPCPKCGVRIEKNQGAFPCVCSIDSRRGRFVLLA